MGVVVVLWMVLVLSVLPSCTGFIHVHRLRRLHGSSPLSLLQGSMRLSHMSRIRRRNDIAMFLWAASPRDNSSVNNPTDNTSKDAVDANSESKKESGKLLAALDALARAKNRLLSSLTQLSSLGRSSDDGVMGNADSSTGPSNHEVNMANDEKLFREVDIRDEDIVNNDFSSSQSQDGDTRTSLKSGYARNNPMKLVMEGISRYMQDYNEYMQQHPAINTTVNDTHTDNNDADDHDEEQPQAVTSLSQYNKAQSNVIDAAVNTALSVNSSAECASFIDSIGLTSIVTAAFYKHTPSIKPDSDEMKTNRLRMRRIKAILALTNMVKLLGIGAPLIDTHHHHAASHSLPLTLENNKELLQSLVRMLQDLSTAGGISPGDMGSSTDGSKKSVSSLVTGSRSLLGRLQNTWSDWRTADSSSSVSRNDNNCSPDGSNGDDNDPAPTPTLAALLTYYEQWSALSLLHAVIRNSESATRQLKLSSTMQELLASIRHFATLNPSYGDAMKGGEYVHLLELQQQQQLSDPSARNGDSEVVAMSVQDEMASTEDGLAAHLQGLIAKFVSRQPQLRSQLLARSYEDNTSNTSSTSGPQHVVNVFTRPEMARICGWALGGSPSLLNSNTAASTTSSTTSLISSLPSPPPRQSLMMNWRPKREGQRGLRRVSLDGGGVRGILSLSMLSELLAQLDKQPQGVHPRRPHELFDVICGTSTGGIIASLFVLGRCSAAHALETYQQFLHHVFPSHQQPANQAQQRLSAPGTMRRTWNTLQGIVKLLFTDKSLYSEKEFERLLEEMLGEENRLLLDCNRFADCPRLLLVSTHLMQQHMHSPMPQQYQQQQQQQTMPESQSGSRGSFQTPLTPSVHLWRNYDIDSIHDMQRQSSGSTMASAGSLISKYRGSCRIFSKDAIRATTAAPMLFVPISYNHELFCDGAIVANNPTAIAIQEAKALFPGVPIELVVSVGTGLFTSPQAASAHVGERATEAAAAGVAAAVSSATSTKNPSSSKKQKPGIGWQQLVTQLIASTVATEDVHETLADLLPDTTYHRFNPYLHQFVPIDETDENLLTYLKESGQKYIQSLFVSGNAVQRERLLHLSHLLSQPPQLS
jgi:patatin-like phospholipase/acyl hydrolase